MKILKHIFYSLFLIIASKTAYSQDNSTPQMGSKNVVSLNILDLSIGNAHLGYERLINNGLIGLKFSVNFDYNENSDAGVTGLKRSFVTSLDLNLYPTGQGRFKYFAGPSFRVGRVATRYFHSNDVSGLTTYDYSNHLGFMGVFFNNGLVIQPFQWLYVGVQGTLGIGLFKSLDKKHSYAQIDGSFALNMGYRF